ncbi:MAG TPA: Dabb family protein [Bacteroidales bacterium]
MIKHIVMWTINPAEGLDKNATLLKMKERLESLRGKIEGMVSLQTGINQNSSPDASEFCLITEHKSWDDLQHYQDHPLHKEVAGFIGSVRKTRTVADFEF